MKTNAIRSLMVAIAWVVLVLGASAQDTLDSMKASESSVPNLAKDSPETVRVYSVVEVEVQAAFPGGEWELNKFIERSVRNEYLVHDVQGRVYVQFIVERDGSVSGLQIVKAFSPSFDVEAIRVMRTMPIWIPARKGGETVRMERVVAVPFRLP
jgi:TonB family protein